MKAEPAKPLQRSLTTVDEALAELHELASSLASRLEPITTPMHGGYAEPSDGSDSDVPDHSPVVWRIDSQAASIRQVSNQLRTMLDAIEV